MTTTQRAPMPTHPRVAGAKQVAFPYAVKATDTEGTIEGYASVFGVTDFYNEIVDKGAFTKTLTEHPSIPVFWEHWKLAGVSVEHREDDHGLWVRGELNLDVQVAREAWALAKQGAVTGLSIGFRPIKVEKPENPRDPVHIKELRLYEYSLVSFPANEAATIETVKALAEPPADAEPLRLALHSLRTELSRRHKHNTLRRLTQ